MDPGVRIDKWLWAVRAFKTRSQATDACRSGKVRISGQVVKPSREVKLEEIITLQHKLYTRTVQVTGLIEKRASAKLAADHMKDLTPEEEYEQLRIKLKTNSEFRQRGLGRPTKKERRVIEKLKNHKHL
jgi:ribosome-associated heat shock protein Hsp15